MTLIIGRDGLKVNLSSNATSSELEPGTLVVSPLVNDRQTIGEVQNEDALVIWETGDTERIEPSQLTYAGLFHSMERLSSAKKQLVLVHSELSAASLAKPLEMGDYVVKPGSKKLGRVILLLGNKLMMVMWIDGKMESYKDSFPVIRAEGFSEKEIKKAGDTIDKIMEKVKATSSFPFCNDHVWREVIAKDIIPDGDRKGQARFSDIGTAKILRKVFEGPYAVRRVGYGKEQFAIFVNETTVMKGLSQVESEDLFENTLSNLASVLSGTEISPDMAYFGRRGALIKSKKYDPKEATDKVLVDDHRITHAWYKRLSRGKSIGTWTLKEVIKVHGDIVDEMLSRNFKHDSSLPPVNNHSLLDEAYFKILALEEELRTPAVVGEGIANETPADWFNKVSQALNWLTLAVQKLIRVYRIDEANALLDFMFSILNMSDLANEEQFAEKFSELIKLRSRGIDLSLTGEPEMDVHLEREFEMLESSNEKLSDYHEQADPYLELPSEEKEHDFVMQLHWRGIDKKEGVKKGASVHTDWRMEVNDHLVGWTLSDPKSGGMEPRLTNEPGMDGEKILSFTKARQPKEWLSLADEGDFWAPPGAIGATKNTWGSLEVLDSGTVEFLAQKSDFHEYYIHGKEFNGIFVVRKLKNVWGGRAGKDPFVWMMWKTKEQVPHVLGKRAVKFQWMPPAGFSALPKEWRKKIPSKLRWWTDKTWSKAKRSKMRDEAVEFLESKEKLQEELRATDFTLHYRWWKGQKVIRDQRKEFWDLSYVDESGRVKIWTIDGNPTFEPERTFNTSSIIVDDKDWMKKKGEIKPGVFGNPNKKISAFIEILDSGKLNVIEEDEDFISLKFKGKKMKGLWVLKRKPGESLWSFAQGELPGEDKEENVSSEDLRKAAENLLPKSTKSELSKESETKGLKHYRLTVSCLSAKKPDNGHMKLAKMKLPLTIEGIALEEGRHHGVWYPGPIIAESAPMLEFQRLQLEHGDQAMDVIGWVTKAWGEDKMRVNFEALVYDEQSARDILDGKKRAVSVGVWIEEKKTPEGRVVKKIMKYDELTVTDSPECPTCVMQPKGGE